MYTTGCRELELGGIFEMRNCKTEWAMVFEMFKFFISSRGQGVNYHPSSEKVNPRTLNAFKWKLGSLIKILFCYVLLRKLLPSDIKSCDLSETGVKSIWLIFRFFARLYEKMINWPNFFCIHLIYLYRVIEWKYGVLIVHFAHIEGSKVNCWPFLWFWQFCIWHTGISTHCVYI